MILLAYPGPYNNSDNSFGLVGLIFILVAIAILIGVIVVIKGTFESVGTFSKSSPEGKVAMLKRIQKVFLIVMGFILFIIFTPMIIG
jgi:uncharacterized membrane protein HdeD (DUF308 family)